MSTVIKPTRLTTAKLAAAVIDPMIKRLGEIENKLDRQQADMEEAVQETQKQFQEVIDKLAAERDELMGLLDKQLVQHRLVLTDDGKKKTIELRSGVVRWRYSKPALHFEEGKTEKSVISRLRKLRKLKPFTRRAELKLEKEALKKDPSFVARFLKGYVFIGRREDLIIKPRHLEREVVKLGNPRRIPGKTVRKD